MKDFKRYGFSKGVILLLVMFLSTLALTSCSKDDEPKKGSDPVVPGQTTVSNELVGTWYFTYNGETNYDDYFIFRADGTGLYHYDDEQSDDFTYTYDAKSKILALNFKHWESERFPIEWLGNNAIEFDGYGKYVRK